MVPTLLALATLAPSADPAPDPAPIRQAVTLYASFDESPRADFGNGLLTLMTRAKHPTEKDKFLITRGFDEKVFTIARNKGVAGGALAPQDVLPDNGRVFFPAKENIGYKPGGWGGAVSLWLNTDPDKLLKTKFCDPVQITQRGAHDGAIWVDFNDAKPRALRHGAFTALRASEKPIPEDDPKAPMVRVPAIGFKEGEWHHVVVSWSNFDTGKPDAVSALYIDGQLKGEVKDREISMAWTMDLAGIYVAINYLGLLDEFAVFGRPLTADEVKLLHQTPGLLQPLKKKP